MVEWKREVSLAIFWAAAVQPAILIAVKDNHTHTKGA